MTNRDKLVEDLITLYSGIDYDDFSYVIDYYVDYIADNGDVYDDSGDILDDLKGNAMWWLVSITADYITTNLSLPIHNRPYELNRKWYGGSFGQEQSSQEMIDLNIKGIVAYCLHITKAKDTSLVSIIRQMKLDLVLGT